MRILWVSNGRRVKTGYGGQTNLFAPRLKQAGHEVAIFAIYGIQGAPSVDEDGIISYPPFVEPAGNDIVNAHAKHVNADVVITLYDPLAFHPDKYGRLNWAAWTPVDSEPLFPGNAQALQAARWVIAMSRYGETQLRNAGFDPLYAPHGINTKVFAPGNRDEARAKLSNHWEVDLTGKFLVAMNAANKGSPSRKGFFEAFAAFKVFSDSHPDALLYVHAEKMGVWAGEHLETHAQMLGLDPAKVIYAPQYQLITGLYSEQFLADVYNAADVLLQPSHGEGFGIPIIEAQASGCPVIVTDFSAMPELVRAGWKVPGMPFCHATGATQRIPLLGELSNALDAAYEKRGDEAFRAQARAVADDYDVDVVLERHWKPILDRMEQDIQGDVEAVTDSRRRRLEKRRALRAAAAEERGA